MLRTYGTNISYTTKYTKCVKIETKYNPLNAELNPICHLLALLGVHPILHVSGIRVKCTDLTIVLLMVHTILLNRAKCVM